VRSLAGGLGLRLPDQNGLDMAFKIRGLYVREDQYSEANQ
jgi:hypothetical protein